MPTDRSTFFEEAFASQRIMLILRGHSPDETVRRAEQAWDLGIEIVEVPVETPNALPSLYAALDMARKRGKVLGAGTVFTTEQLDAVAEVRVDFTVAPGFDPAIAKRSLDLGLPHLPGVSSATEIQRALSEGFRWVKAFPASVLGEEWFRAMRGPFPSLRIVATGGVDADNAAGFIEAGADVVSLGSSLPKPEQLRRTVEILNAIRR